MASPRNDSNAANRRARTADMCEGQNATSNFHVITHEHMKRIKNNAIVCNIGHFDDEIDRASLQQYTWESIKPQVDHIIFPDSKRIIFLAERRFVNLACGTAHPSYVMSSSFANQTWRRLNDLRIPQIIPSAYMCCQSAWSKKWRVCS